jgi:integrase
MQFTTVPTTARKSTSALGLNEGDWTFHFKFEGRRFGLIKRNKSRDGAWWLETIIHGHRIVRSLDTNVAAAAQQRAISDYIRPAKAGQWAVVKAQKLKSEWASIGEVCAAYGRLATTGSKAENVNALFRIFEVLGTNRASAAKLSTTVLTPAWLRQFKAKFVAARVQYLAGDEARRAERRACITGGAYVRFARCIVSREMRQLYRDEGLRLPPNIEEFIAERVFKSVTVDYNPASDSIITDTFAFFERLAGAKSMLGMNLFKAFWLVIGTGLRKGEASRTEWGHFEEHGGETFLAGAVVGKDGLDVRVPVMPQAWARLQGLRQAQGLVLEGGASEVKDRVWRRLARVMRKRGWKTQKKAHELRAYMISKIAETHGLSVASEWARHKDPGLTRRKYGRYLKLKGIAVALPGL